MSAARRLRRCGLLAAGWVALAASAADAAEDLKPAIDAALTRAAAWATAQQDSDGGWHSTTYGQMRGGAGNTALMVAALAKLPADVRRNAQPAIDRGIGFLLANLDESGYVRAPDGSSDYPNYATALTLIALNRLRPDEGEKATSSEAIDRMRNYLIAAQLKKRLPWANSDDDIGGWSLVGGDLDDNASFRDVNLSATRLALEALAAPEAPAEVAALAGAYVARLQNADGGFRFVADVDDPLNKAGIESISTNEFPAGRSYGTATADGLSALLACGEHKREQSVQRAAEWLSKNDSVEIVPGFAAIRSASSPASPQEGLRFYYLAALAGAMERSPAAPFSHRRSPLVDALLREQAPDGSWQNSTALMREDDPLIATGLAIEALAAVRDLP